MPPSRDSWTWTLARRAAFLNTLVTVLVVVLVAVAAWATWQAEAGAGLLVPMVVVSLVAVAVIVAVHWCVRWLTHAIARPIEVIVEGARYLRAGELHHRVTLPEADDEFDQLASAFNQMAARLEVDNKALTDLARHDELTGLVNRREGRRVLIAEIERTARYGRPLTALLLDIDRFKLVNDTHGHPAGDAVLQAVASRITATIRPTDVAVRWGGEEFAVLLTETDPQQGAAAAERLRQVLAAEPVVLEDGTHLQVTASFGVAAAPTHTNDPDQLMSFADQALYAAKDGGRNRVVSYPAQLGNGHLDPA